MQETNDKDYKIKDISTILNVSIITLKNWEDKGYIPKARRNKWEWRVYNEREKEAIVATVKKHNYFRKNRGQH